MIRIARSLVAVALLASPAVATAQDDKATAKPTRPSIYDARADARQQVRDASAKAGRDGKRLLVVFGGDWCGWCHKLHELFASDQAIRQVLADEYLLVMVDTQAPHADDLLAECRGDLERVGYPFLAVLDGAGKVVTRQPTDPLEEGDHHDPAKVKRFLDEWVAPRPSAAAVLADALARASSEDKRVFLQFGTPTCGWCRKLEAFLDRPDMAPIFAKDFVVAKLDLVRTPGAEEVRAKYAGPGAKGVPWYVFLDAQGKAIVTSDGPMGNVGFPANEAEVAHFVAMLEQACRRIEPSQVAAVAAALKPARATPGSAP